MIADLLERTIREVVRQEVKVALEALPRGAPALSAASRWTTPPKAAQELGVPVKTIRRMVRDGRITARQRNIDANPSQVKYLVNLDEVAAAAERVGRPGHNRSQESLAEKAARLRAVREGE